MKRLSVLGSTGSIGTQTLDVVRENPEEFRVIAMTAGRNLERFRAQLAEFRPGYAAVAEEQAAAELGREFPDIQFGFGMEGICTAAAIEGADMTVNGLLGMMGIRPTLAAVEAGKDVAFANKETLVAGGSIIMDAVKRCGVGFLPVDSEHSAIFQCLQGAAGNRLKRILLTASGGPFRGYTKEQLKNVTVEQALGHPTWSMGAKITVDSATMMNKGLEVIEASWLFDMPARDITVVVHPQSIVHSAIEFEDGAVIAQLGAHDMRLPIAYALSYPKRLPAQGRSIDLFDIARLDFEEPHPETFECLALAFDAAEKGGSWPIVLNAANELAVAAFLKKELSFTGIADCVKAALDHHDGAAVSCVDDILETQRRTEEFLCQQYLR